MVKTCTRCGEDFEPDAYSPKATTCLACRTRAARKKGGNYVQKLSFDNAVIRAKADMEREAKLRRLATQDEEYSKTVKIATSSWKDALTGDKWVSRRNQV